MLFLGWLFSVFLSYFFYSTLPLLAGTWMVVVSILFLIFSAIAIVTTTVGLVVGER